MTLQPPLSDDWYMDSGTTAHMTFEPGNLTSLLSPILYTPKHIIVGNGSFLPITHTSHASLFTMFSLLLTLLKILFP